MTVCLDKDGNRATPLSATLATVTGLAAKDLKCGTQVEHGHSLFISRII